MSDPTSAAIAIETAGGLVWKTPHGWKVTLPSSSVIYTRDDEGLIELSRTLNLNQERMVFCGQ